MLNTECTSLKEKLYRTYIICVKARTVCVEWLLYLELLYKNIPGTSYVQIKIRYSLSCGNNILFSTSKIFQ